MELRPSHLSPQRILRMFSSSADAARQRRPTDVIMLTFSLALVLLLTLDAPGPAAVDQSISAVLADGAGLLGWLWELSYTLLLVWAVVLVLAPVVSYRRGRLPLLWDYGLAVAASLAVSLTVSAVAGTGVPASLEALVTADPPPVYVAVRLAMVSAVVVTASPHVTRPFRVVGRGVLALGATATAALGIAYTTGVLAGLAVGLATAAGVHLVRGSPGGRLTAEQVGEAMLDLGIETTLVEPVPAPGAGEQLLRARGPAGEELLVKVFGRDAWDAQYIGSLWIALTRRGETPRLTMSRRERVDREAMVSLLAQRAGVPVLPVVTSGEGVQGEALLVTEAPARAFADLNPEELDADRLRKAWSALTSLHAQGIANRRITAHHLVERRDGTVAWGDLGQARLAAAGTDLMIDRVHLLVSTWLLVGPERAVAAALEALGRDGLAQALPYLQEPLLSPPLRRAMGTEWQLEDLRGRALQAVGVTTVPVVELRRVTAVSLIKTLLVVVVASSLFSIFAGVDLAELVDQVRSADYRLLLVALLVAPLAQLVFSLSTLGASLARIPFLPVLLLQYAIQFIALVLPSTGARVALQIRFFERQGVPSGAAMTMGMLDGASGFVVQVSLLLVIWLGSLPGVTTTVSAASEGGGEDGSTSPSLLALALLIALLWGVVTVAVPRRRARAMRAVPKYREALKNQAIMARSALQVLRHPRKLAMMLGGNLGGQVIQAVVLGVCLSAFGESATLSQLILVNTFVSLFSGIMPVPGGIGVAEAGYIYGLQAVGVPSAVAVSAAITFRLVTFYLPPLWGVLAMRWLRRNAYV